METYLASNDEETLDSITAFLDDRNVTYFVLPPEGSIPRSLYSWSVPITVVQELERRKEVFEMHTGIEPEYELRRMPGY